MNGSSELAQLAHLLETSAEAARDIAVLRGGDGDTIASLANQLDSMARLMERLAYRVARR